MKTFEFYQVIKIYILITIFLLLFKSLKNVDLHNKFWNKYFNNLNCTSKLLFNMVYEIYYCLIFEFLYCINYNNTSIPIFNDFMN